MSSDPTTTRTTSELVVRDLCKSYPTPSGPLHVLKDLSMRLDAGQSVAVVGPSGSGKSTLLQILGTLDRPDSGEFLIAGRAPLELSPRPLAAFRNQNIGFVFQDHHLLPHLNVIENVLVPTLAAGRVDDTRQTKAIELLDAVGLADRRGHLPGQLSGGERERVAIARALLMEPSLILADEPTGNLDRRTAETITRLLLDLQKASGAILVTVTHSEKLAESMDSQMELVDGRLVSL
ncbi:MULTISPECIES: ABC transporter ATP-binding protein [Crateriforma]|uniref:Lipoprotein-releasing system ATP-binding protein LolD n=1 Tax=Crateriforma conspicua TaxID=2527996 RepID=A0A5C6FQN6_9PLAN|nr:MULTISPECIES: ABC transporter ATP-binding protein [Crateriforma]TWU62793.1 Lipoprotein-releasing system ATP-binding protein LolD [Crateriforma conspicua]